MNVDGNASATIGDVAVGGSGAVGGISVNAHDDITSDLLVVSVNGGVGAGLSAAMAFADLGGTAKATSGAHGTVGSGGLTITADGTHTVTVKTVNIAVGLGAAVGVTVARANNARSLEAGTSSSGDLTFTSPAPVSVTATASNSADAEAPGGGGGAFQSSIMLAFAVLSGHTTTTMDGSVSNATDITISAIADNTAIANSFVFGVSVIGLNGGAGFATLDTGSDIEASVGSTASLGGSGTIKVEAKTRNDGNKADAKAEGGAFGALALRRRLHRGRDDQEQGRGAHGRRRHLRRLARRERGRDAVSARAHDRRQHEPRRLARGLVQPRRHRRRLARQLRGRAGRLDRCRRHEQARGDVAQHVDGDRQRRLRRCARRRRVDPDREDLGLDHARPTTARSPAARASTSRRPASTRRRRSANPIAIGLFAGAGAAADADITSGAQVNAGVGQHATLTLDGAAATIKASATDNATATTDTGLAVGFAGSIALLSVEAHDRGGSHASFDGELVSASQLTVQTDTTRSTDAHLFVVSISLGFGAAFADATATIGDDSLSVDEAFLGTHTNIHSPGTAITVKATRGASATATADGGAGGILAGGAVMKAVTSVTGAIEASRRRRRDDRHERRQAERPAGARQRLRRPRRPTPPSARARSASRAAAATPTRPRRRPSRRTSARTSTSCSPTGSATTSRSRRSRQNAEADATSKSYGGGGIHVGGPEATATSNPTVHAYIGSGSTVFAGGKVEVDGESNATGNLPHLNDDITGLTPDGGSPNPDSVTFPVHGLTNGDLVRYESNGGGVIGGLHDDHVYGVIVVDANTLRFGSTFLAAAADADSLDGTIAGVDANRAMVRFSSPHHLVTGDAVIYRTAGSSISGDFGDGSVLYVRVIDDYTLELYTSQSDATSAAFTFGPGAVSGNQISNSTLADGQRYTYQTGAPLKFRAGGVDVDTSGGSINGDDSGADDIFLGHVDFSGGPTNGHGLSEGQRVIYQVSDASQHIGNLVDGGIYYVHVVDAWTIQLATTYCNAVAHGFDSSCGNSSRVLIAISRPSDATVQHAIRPAPLGALVDGDTYLVHRVDSGHITLRSPSAPAVDLSLDKTDGASHTVIAGDFFGNQALFKAGSVLHTASGNQQIYVRLTGSLPSSTEALLASDGSSLRAASPPSGTGDTSASARGGGGGLGDFSFPGATTNVNPTVKSYVAGSLDVGGDVTVTSNITTNATASTENGSGGAIAVADVESDIKGTDNNSAFIGADFAGNGISGDPATPKIDAGGITIKAGGNIKVSATTFLSTSISADTDGGGAFDASHANSTTDLHDNTTAAVGKNAHVTGSTVALISSSGGFHHGTADAFAVAFIGGAIATASFDLDSHSTAFLDGDSSN